MWLRDFLPGNTPSARVLVYGYNSALLGSNTSVSGIKDFAYDLLQRILDDRTTDEVARYPLPLLLGILRTNGVFLGKKKTHCIHMPFTRRNCSEAGKQPLQKLRVRHEAPDIQTELSPRLLYLLMQNVVATHASGTLLIQSYFLPLHMEEVRVQTLLFYFQTSRLWRFRDLPSSS